MILSTAVANSSVSPTLGYIAENYRPSQHYQLSVGAVSGGKYHPACLYIQKTDGALVMCNQGTVGASIFYSEFCGMYIKR